MHFIYIVNKKGKPLMPTTRQARIRHLIREKKAVVINGNPFTVRLKYDTPDITQQIYGGMDTGRENIGTASSFEDGCCVYRAEVMTNNKAIHKEMVGRKACRQSRKRYDRQKKQRKAFREDNTIRNGQDTVLRNNRECKSVTVRYSGAEVPVECKVIHGQEAQFSNRKREEGWLTPSARHLIQMHVLSFERMCEILPITDFALENVKFDFQKLENEGITDWQHGPLYGYKDYKAYINDIQDGKCLLCGCDHIDEYHHIIPKSEGGSDTAKNIAGLCWDCHHEINGVHKNNDNAALLSELKEGKQSIYKVSLLNSIMPYLIAEFADVCSRREINFHVTNGYETKRTRERYGILKGHDFDAYAISLSGREGLGDVNIFNNSYKLRRFKKKSNNNIQANGQREYYLGKKLVAINRHKAETQNADSLEEFRNSYGEDAVSRLTVKPAKRIYTFHKADVIAPIHAGDIVRYEKHNKIKGNTKITVFVADSVRIGEQKVSHDGTKSKKLKYCRRIHSGCLQYVK